MNQVILIGRLTKDPEVRYAQNSQTAIARYTIAVDRKFKKDNEPSADFLNCASFGKSAEFAEKYFKKGMKIAITGRIQTGSYTNKDGQKIYTTDIMVDSQEFCESKSTETKAEEPQQEEDKWMSIPEGMEEEMPFA